MKAMVLYQHAPIEERPLVYTELPRPSPSSGELLVQISACGVCRTDLHLVEGELSPSPLPIIPGHQGVGIVVELGSGCRRFVLGDRVGIAWLRHTCQACSFCDEGRENLCDSSRYTGYHESGAYAEYAVVPEDYAYAIPSTFSDTSAAPLLCGGIIGYHAYKRCQLPAGGRLGMFGFGGSAHLILPIAVKQGHDVYVFTRGEHHRKLALSLGAAWAGSADDIVSELLDSAIVFAPAGTLVPKALKAIRKGGVVVIADIVMSDIPSMQYQECLFHEKMLCSVEANTRMDGAEFLEVAASLSLSPAVQIFSLFEANEALLCLKQGKINGTAVLTCSPI